MPPKAPAHLQFEQSFWGDCCNTFDEQQKHYVYARLMGISLAKAYSLAVGAAGGRRILDIGGGPCSMLLLADGDVSGSVVVDPTPYPAWTRQRYRSRGIDVKLMAGEDVSPDALRSPHSPQFHEVWIYNCLQHCEDPEKIILNALRCARVLRLFEWVDIPPHEGHPHQLSADLLNLWTGSIGTVHELSSSGCYGRGYGVTRIQGGIGQAVPALP
jgi:hypothetical protein